MDLKNQKEKLVTKTYYFSEDNRIDYLKNIEFFFSNQKVRVLISLTFICVFLTDLLDEYFINKETIILDNILYPYEENYDFSQYKTKIKAISVYYPTIYSLEEKDAILNNKQILEKINNEINLAKSHGIYGFCFYYYCEEGKDIFSEPLDIIITNKSLNINFFIAWNNYKYGMDNNINEQIKFIFNLKNYIYDNRYIKINGKPMVGIYNPTKISDLKNTTKILREKAKEFGLDELYIIALCNGNDNITILNEYSIFNAFADLNAYSKEINKLYQGIYYYLYSSNIERNENISKIYENSKYNIYRSSFQVSQYPIELGDNNFFKDYMPEKYYFINKIIIDWTNKKYKENNRFIFINSNDNNYFNPQNEFGYSSLNYLSHALFDIPLGNKIYNLSNLEQNCSVAIQVHVFYTDLLSEVVNYTNNIPVPFDLYISTDSQQKKLIIEEYIKTRTKAINYEILIFENKGRDVLPFLTQFKNVIHKYKYFGHIHTKKTPNFIYHEDWRRYLYENLLGNKDIISEILTNFENNEKLGVIFPETFYGLMYEIIKGNYNEKYMNIVLNEIFPGKKVGNFIEFPVGDMFWARSNAVYQMFGYNLAPKCPKERGQIDLTILHAIERLWLFVAKINGYYYKKILKYC